MATVAVSMHELLIIDCVALDRCDITALFLPERDFFAATGERWHGLDPDACLIAMARLVSLGLIELRTTREMVPGSRSEPEYVEVPRTSVCLTERGGACWERAFDVDWRWYVFDVVEDSDGETTLQFRLTFGSRDGFERWKRELAASPLSSAFVFSDVGVDRWQRTPWKVIANAVEVQVATTVPPTLFAAARETLSHSYFSVRDAFKSTRVPIDFQWPVDEPDL